VRATGVGIVVGVGDGELLGVGYGSARAFVPTKRSIVSAIVPIRWTVDHPLEVRATESFLTTGTKKRVPKDPLSRMTDNSAKSQL
jgi:hypothetical protein